MFEIDRLYFSPSNYISIGNYLGSRSSELPNDKLISLKRSYNPEIVDNLWIMLSGLKELIDEAELARIEDPEEISIVSNLDWQTYESLLTRLADNSHYRVMYLNGILEIVSPSLRHEKIKKRLATLLERYLVLQQIQHTPMGSTTLKNQLKHAGAEPDECYCIGIETEIPDLAIEVNITSGNINKLAIYQQLGVREVWFWEGNCLTLYCLREEVTLDSSLTNGYERVERSELIPDLNISLLSECVLISDQLESITEFEQGI
jgi:Uma2 family endonuclease